MSDKCPVHGIPDCSPLLNGCSFTPAPSPTPRDELADKDARIAELEAEVKDLREHYTFADAQVETSYKRENALRAERDVLADKVRVVEKERDDYMKMHVDVTEAHVELMDAVEALADEWDERDPNPPHPRSERLRAILSDPAPPAAQMPTTAGQAWEEYAGPKGFSDYDSRRRAFLAGFDAGAER